MVLLIRLRWAAAREYKLDLQLTMQSYLQAFAANLISVGVRIIPIGQQAGQDCLVSLCAIIEQMKNDLIKADLERLGSATFMSEVMSMKHEKQIQGYIEHDRDKLKYGPLRVGIGGPVGAGKTSMTEALCKRLASDVSMAVITNDIYTKEDADYLVRSQVLTSDRICGVETGGCPHTAIREDASVNLAAMDELKGRFQI